MEATTQTHQLNTRPGLSASLSRQRRIQNAGIAIKSFGILPIHASAVSANGGAWVFLGPSGTGKSTICKLLSAGTQPLADDTTFIIPHDRHDWVVADASNYILGGPPTKEETTYIKSHPLKAIFRLYQAPELRLIPNNALETCRHLMNAFFELYWQQQLDIKSKKLAYAGFAAITQAIPGYQCHFCRSDRVLEMIEEEMTLRDPLTRINAIGEEQ